MKYISYAIVSLLIGVVAAFLLINSGVLRDYVQKEVRTKTGLAVEIGSLRLEPRWPLTLNIGPSKIPAPHVTLAVKGAQVVVASFAVPYDIRVRVEEPSVRLNGPLASFSTTPKSAAPGAKTDGGGGGGAAGQFRLQLQVINGEFRAHDLGVSVINVDFEQKLWMSSRAPAKVDFSARVDSSYLPGSWPITLHSDSLVLSEEAIKAQSVTASFAGLLASVQGTSLLGQGRHRWLAEVKAPDLKALPKPPFEVPASDWSGAIEVRAEVVKDGTAAPWSASGNARAEGVRARLKWQKEKTTVDGPVTLDFAGKFSYQNEKFSLPELTGVADLTSALVLHGDLLQKPKDIALKVEAQVAGDNSKLEIKKLETRFWQIVAQASGSITPKSPFSSQLQLEIPMTSLKGIEALLLPLRKSPVQGDVALKAEYSGPLTDPWAAVLRIQKLSLKNFAADVTYEGATSLKVRGPIMANVDVKGEMDRGVPKAFEGSGNLQLSGLALVAGPLRKEPRQPLAATFNIRTDGTALRLQPLAIKGFLGDIKMNGTVREPKRPKVALRLEAQPLDLSELRVAMPSFRDVIPKGSVVGRISLDGDAAIDQPWAEWPLTVAGDLKVNLPEYLVAPAAAAGDVSGAPPSPNQAAGPPQGFLPKGALTERMNLQTALDVGVLRKDKLTVKGLAAAGRVQSGRFRGSVAVGEVFGGQVRATQLDVPLLEPLPLLTGALALEQIIVQDALEFMKPDYKTMATGRAKGTLTFSTRMPADARFMDELKSKGQIVLQPIVLNTIKIGQILNDLMAKIPGVKLPPAKVTPLKGMVQLDYQLAAQAMTLSPLLAREEDGSELELKGKVIVPTMEGDLVGNFMWAGSGVKGCLLEGNADAKGRLVVPVALKGNLMQPQISMLTDTAGKLAGRALECEKNKLIEKVKKDGGESLRKEGEKLLKGILGK